jgi:hypothetical protein
MNRAAEFLSPAGYSRPTWPDNRFHSHRTEYEGDVMSNPKPPRWLKPMNKFMIAVQKLGIPTGPPMVLTVPGRKTGRPRSTPMTPFSLDGHLYAVAGFPDAD